MERRTFLKHSSVLSMGFLAGKDLMPQLDAGRIVYGQNQKRYTFDKNWVKAKPANFPVKDCHEMVQDDQKRLLLLTNETKNNVLFFDKKGRVTQSWGQHFPGAHGLTIAGNGNEQYLYITDTETHQVFKTTIDGRILQTWDVPMETAKYTQKAQFVPTETAIASNGDMYVADGYGAQYIIHYDANGIIKNIFGGRGEGEQQFDNAHGICIDHRTTPNTLLITDRTRCCFKRFSMEGVYIETISLPGACVCRPVIKGDYLYTAVLRSPDLNHENSGFVLILDKNNAPVSVIGGSEIAHDKAGNLLPFYQTIQLFQHPHDVMIDDEENLYVCQWASGKVYPYRFVPIA